MKLSESFASVYYPLFQELLDLEVADEKWADCSNCHACLNKNQRQFNTKCCDYQPSIPNYIVGCILSDADSQLQEGKKIILQQIKNQKGVTPFGILPTTEYQERFSKSRNNINDITQEETNNLRCPFFFKGGCSIHKHRSDMCGTYYCISVKLSAGMPFWEASTHLNQLLDKGISIMVAETMGFKEKTKSTLKEMVTTIEVDKDFNHSAYGKTWKKWEGSEIDYFKQCYEVFKKLNKEELEKELGHHLSDQINKVKALHTQTSNYLVPQQLQFDEEKWATLPGKQEINSIDIWLLRLFDGRRKTDEVIKKALLMNVSITKTIEQLIEQEVLKEV